MILRLALALSLDKENDNSRVVERPDDGGDGVDLELAVILLTFIGVDIDEFTEAADANEVMEVFAMLDVAMTMAAAAAAAALRAARVLFFLL